MARLLGSSEFQVGRSSLHSGPACPSLFKESALHRGRLRVGHGGVERVGTATGMGRGLTATAAVTVEQAPTVLLVRSGCDQKGVAQLEVEERV